MNKYYSLHNHTDHSNLRLIDSINTIEKLIDRAHELGLSGVAITDHESVSGHVQAIDYYNKKYADKKNEFKLILGNEIYLTKEGLNLETHGTGEAFNHMVLLAKDKIGHRQLRELSTRAWKRSYHKNLLRTPTYRSDLIEVIGSEQGHIIATTACLGGGPGYLFKEALQLGYLNKSIEFEEWTPLQEHPEITNFLNEMQDIFGKENFFIELQPNQFNYDQPLEKQNLQILYNANMIINYWGKFPFIYTTDSHYLKAEDREIHKLFLRSKSGDREVDEFYFYSYMMGYQEITDYFRPYISETKIQEMTLNTIKIGESIEHYDISHPQMVPKIKYNFDRFDQSTINTMYDFFMKNIDKEKHSYLHYFLNNEEEADTYFINLVLEGYYKKIYLSNSSVTIPERIDRLNYELEQIYETSKKINQSLSDYFITMAKIIEIIWDDAESLVGPGRGSASGFLLNYLIGITQIDPQSQMLYLPPWRLAIATYTAGYK